MRLLICFIFFYASGFSQEIEVHSITHGKEIGDWKSLERIVSQKYRNDSLIVQLDLIADCAWKPVFTLEETQNGISIAAKDTSFMRHACTFVYRVELAFLSKIQSITTLKFNDRILSAITPADFNFPVDFGKSQQKKNQLNKQRERIGYWKEKIKLENGQLRLVEHYYAEYLGEIQLVWEIVRDRKGKILSRSFLGNNGLHAIDNKSPN